MKLKNKIYLIQLSISLVFALFFIVMYNAYLNQKEKSLEQNLKTIIQSNKLFIENSLQSIYKDYENNRKFFYKIHQYTLAEFEKNPDRKLHTLKQLVKDHFAIKDFDINLYYIDKSYTITDATVKGDIGFNLGLIEDAKLYLDRAKEDGKIHLAQNISVDIIDSKLNIYSYAKLKNNNFLEMGFRLKESIYINLKKSLERSFTQTDDKVTIYRVTDTSEKKEIYNNLFKDKTGKVESKAAFEESLEKFDKSKPTDNKIINAIRFNEKQSEIQNNKYIVYVPLMQTTDAQHLFYNNLVMKIEIDISSYQNDLEQMQQNFFIFGTMIFLFLTLLFYFVKYNFYKPMMGIIKNFEVEKKITDSILTNKKDEFGILVQKYNKLYDSLTNEIALNTKLLEQNKRFIADTVHQIRTPLTNIMMNGEMVKKFQTDESLSLFVDQIDASINMLSNSYEDLAYVTSYDTIEYKPAKVNVSRLLQKRIDFFATISKVNFKNILSFIDNDIYVCINEIECERIIDNNIANAVKYAKTQHPISIKLYQKDDTVICTFASYGTEIADKEKVFEKNYRENEAKRGLGLGLNMVKGICQKYKIKYTLAYKEEQNIFTYIFPKA